MLRLRYYFLISTCLLFVSHTNAQDGTLQEQFHEKALAIRFSNPDSAVYYFNKDYELNIKNKDTLGIINNLLEVSLLYGHNTNYGKSYDGYWEALFLAEKSKDYKSEALIYQGLGWLYSFFNRDTEALRYFNKSIHVRKNKIEDNEDNRAFIQSDYFSILNLYRVSKNYEKAKVYLDSCYQVKATMPNTPKSYYLEAESGFLDAIDGNFESSLEKLNKCKTYFENNNPAYLVIVHTLLGNVFKLMNDYDESIDNYLKALAISIDLKRHINYRILIYDSLSELYHIQGNYAEAYNYLKLAKDRNDVVFGSKSDNNLELLEIKDKYRQGKENQKKLIDEQHIAELEHEEKISDLKNVLLFSVLIFFGLYVFVWVKHLRNKHKNEKRVLEEKQKLRIKKQSEILELKNKELAESALRLIEKDEFISSIKKKISNQGENIDVNIIKRMLKSIQGTPGGNWKEFEARFTTINQSFYDNLKEKFPNLSQTDQKICALVKLNFPSKDMAKLLGISVESVHTSRYRLRKKLNLTRNDNLEEFIHQI